MTKKHKSAISDFGNSQSHIDFKKKKVNKETHIAEARLALLVAKHTSINVVDHISKTCKSCFSDSPVASSLQLSRTKCAAIIRNVWYPFFQKCLMDDVDGAYSLLVDESTDVGTIKYLGIVLKYFSKTQKKVIGTFLKLEPLESCDAEGIVVGIKSALLEFGLDIKKCVGIGTDNASVMVGRHNGVFAKLKHEIPNLICVCHSLQLAISEVCKEFLPTELEFLVAETYNWFSSSSSRQEQYKIVYQAINDGHDPLKIVKACQTRWLSVETAVTRILDQWLELETHFKLARTADRCFTANQLYEIFINSKLKSYLIFIKPYLQDVQRVNKLFQGSSSTDMSKLFEELCFLIEKTANSITVQRRDFDALSSTVEDYITPNPYLGYDLEKHLKNSNLSEVVVKKIRENCIQFVTKLVYSLRLSDNFKVLRQINKISVKRALRIIKPELAPILEEFKYPSSTITKIDMQWKNLPLVPWTAKSTTSEFWSEVKSFKDAGGNNPFEELAEFACRMLTLPFSNAEVERTFSQMNLVKTKVRNRMEGGMVNAIILIRSSLSNLGKCCSDFEIKYEMIKQIGSKDIYERRPDEESIEAMDIVDEDFFM